VTEETLLETGSKVQRQDPQEFGTCSQPSDATNTVPRSLVSNEAPVEVAANGGTLSGDAGLDDGAGSGDGKAGCVYARQTDRQTERQTDKQTDMPSKKNRQTDRQID
jgi:hypothetical protein